jgi:glycosyltransferase involved in cell wall biosynthesis
LISHEFDPFKGGVATYTRSLGKALYQQEPAFELWAPGKPSRSDPPFVRRLGGKISLRPKAILTLAWNIARHAGQLRGADVILTSVGAQMACMLLSVVGIRPGRRRFCLWHGSELLRFQADPLWSRLAPPYLKRVDGVFAVSDFTASLIDPGLFDGRKPDVAIVRCAPSSDAFPKEDEAAAATPAAAAVRILCLARLHHRKGQRDLIAGMGLLRAELKKKVILQIAGTGDTRYLEQLRKECQAAGVALDYLGGIAPEKLAETYAQCDIYAMTSRTLSTSIEGFGITYLEAGLHGKPVIGYSSGGVREAVRDEETGLLVEEGATYELTMALARLIESPELRRKLGEGNRAFASTFSWQASAQTLLKSLRPSAQPMHTAAAG